MRQDARRNLERIFTDAKESFAEQGSAVTMEGVAKRAGVGVGTLYRRFGSRAGLVEALYHDAVEQVAAEATALARHSDPWEALTRWCRAYVDLRETKRTMLAELTPLFEQRPEWHDDYRRRARVILGGFLTRAQTAGLARDDIDAGDLITLLNAGMAGPSDRLLDIVLAGIRRRDAA